MELTCIEFTPLIAFQCPFPAIYILTTRRNNDILDSLLAQSLSMHIDPLNLLQWVAEIWWEDTFLQNGKDSRTIRALHVCRKGS